MKKSISLLVYLLMVVCPLSAQTECERLFEPIAETIRKNNVVAFSEYFADAVACDILSEEQMYSKEQVCQIVKKLAATEGDVRSFTIKHCSGKELLKYAIGNLTTVNGARYRITMFVNVDEGKVKIQQLRIEKQP